MVEQARRAGIPAHLEVPGQRLVIEPFVLCEIIGGEVFHRHYPVLIEPFEVAMHAALTYLSPQPPLIVNGKPPADYLRHQVFIVNRDGFVP